jgi:hypothetical protein
MSKNVFGILVERDDGEWGLLTTRDPANYSMIERAEFEARKVLADWMWNARIAKTLRLAIIKFDSKSKGTWEIVKFI